MRALKWIIFCVCVLVGGGFVGDARADGDIATKTAKLHYRAGLAAYNAQDYETAVLELKAAYDLKKIPPLLIDIAATYRKLNNNTEAVSYYEQYLREAPQASNRGQVEEALAELKKGRTAMAELDPSAVDEAFEAKQRVAFEHTAIDSAPPGVAIDVKMVAPADLSVSAVVFYRGAGAREFSGLPMRLREGDLVARIPEKAVTSTSLQYYIEARKRKNLVRSIGSRETPNVVVISSEAAAHFDTGLTSMFAESCADGSLPPCVRRLDEESVFVEPGRLSRKKVGDSRALTWTGVALLATGTVALAVGMTGDVLAKKNADIVARDSQPADDGTRTLFNDPVASDRDTAARGKTWNGVGIGLTVAGGALAATGATLMIVDAIRKPRETRATAHNWYLLPMVAPQTLAVSAGTSF